MYAGANHQVDEPDLLAFIRDLSLGWLSVQPKGEEAGHTYNRKQNEPAQNRSGWPARPLRIIGMMEEHRERAAYGYRQGIMESGKTSYTSALKGSWGGNWRWLDLQRKGTRVSV